MSIATAVGDAAWLPHRYDPAGDLVHFVPVTRDMHRRSTFLTDAYLPTDLAPIVISRREAIEHVERTAPIHFIFHSAFCCSTLLARAFDRPGWAMGLKEPTILNDLIGWRRRNDRGPDMATVLDDVLTLLARPFGIDEAIVIKPSNAVHALAAPMLALRPDARAILLYAPLRTYLASVAKKGLDGRLWVRVLLLGLIEDSLIDLGFSQRDYLGLTDLQVAAIGWLAQQVLFTKWIARFGPDRLKTLNSDVLTAHSANVMQELAGWFRMPLAEGDIDEIVGGEAFTRHSKSDVVFAAGDRAEEYDTAATLHADEIDKVMIWANAVAAAAGVAMPPPAVLLPTLSR